MREGIRGRKKKVKKVRSRGDGGGEEGSARNRGGWGARCSTWRETGPGHRINSQTMDPEGIVGTCCCRRRGGESAARGRSGEKGGCLAYGKKGEETSSPGSQGCRLGPGCEGGAFKKGMGRNSKPGKDRKSSLHPLHGAPERTKSP